METISGLQFIENPNFNTIPELRSNLSYKHSNEYISQSKMKINTIDKIQFEGDSIDGSKLNGIRQHTLYSSALDKPTGLKNFCEPETKLFWKCD